MRIHTHGGEDLVACLNVGGSMKVAWSRSGESVGLKKSAMHSHGSSCWRGKVKRVRSVVRFNLDAMNIISCPSCSRVAFIEEGTTAILRPSET